MKEILIITNSHDIHADILMSKLAEKNIIPFRIDLNAFPRDFEIVQQITQGRFVSSLRHISSERQIDFDRIGAVWTRKTADFTFYSDDLAEQEVAYATNETQHILNGLLYSLDCFWMNHPLASRASLWKYEQSLRAAKMGFKIPNSLVTNKPEEVIAFKAQSQASIITKSMSDSALAVKNTHHDDVIATGLNTTVVTDEMMEDIESVREIPCYFQDYIEKAYELRVTVVGDKVFTAKINSQDDERTKIDFRDFSVDIAYEAYQLPKKVEKRCIDFIKSYGLNYGAIDLIVSLEGEFIFLENNPNGQFLFIEELVPELKIMDAHIEQLIKGAV